jgi:hypothetical protein
MISLTPELITTSRRFIARFTALPVAITYQLRLREQIAWPIVESLQYEPDKTGIKEGLKLTLEK